MPKYKSRKYIDLILKASSKWGTLEPFSRKIEAGDFGKVNEDTGEFEYHGNIYKDPEVLDRRPELTEDKYKPEISEPIDEWIITAGTSTRSEFDASADLDAFGNVAEASLKVKLTFKKGARGAFLVMYKPQTTNLPKDILLDKLHDLEPLKGMFLVTSTVACPAYTLGLSDDNAKDMRLAFVGSLPILAAVGSSAGATSHGTWIADNKTGIYQEGCDKDGNFKYGPLYTLKQMRNTRGWLPQFRDSPGPQRFKDELWIPAQTPWTSLDEDGDEEEFFDDVISDSD